MEFIRKMIWKNTVIHIYYIVCDFVYCVDRAWTDVEYDVESAEFIAMYHFKSPGCVLKMPPELRRHLFVWNLFVFVFALLICDTATCFASWLARCLTFAATAFFCTFAEIFCIKSFDAFHKNCLHKFNLSVL